MECHKTKLATYFVAAYEKSIEARWAIKVSYVMSTKLSQAVSLS